MEFKKINRDYGKIRKEIKKKNDQDEYFQFAPENSDDSESDLEDDGGMRGY